MINCQFENGNKDSLRHVVTDSICVKNGKILLIKRSEHLVEGGKYALPGGFLDRDELIEEGVLREFREETGYEGKVIRLLKIVDNPNRGDDRQNISFIFEIEFIEKVGEPDKETEGVFWFDLVKLPSNEKIAFDHAELINDYLNKKL